MILPQDLPKVAYVTADAVKVYLNTLSPKSDAHCLTITKETHALKAIELIVNSKVNISSVVDGGSQIIAMAEQITDHLKIHYNPSIKLNIKLANR